jgi:ATP-dependent DNA helicase 2 subunit 2
MMDVVCFCCPVYLLDSLYFASGPTQCHSTRGMGTCPLEREAGKASAAMSALAKAMLHTGTAALTRAVWSQNSDKVSFGALTPHITPEGDFLIFTPMPYSEDMYSSDFKPLPVTGSASATQLAPALAARLVPTQDQRAAAAALVDALDGAGPEPWRCLNPALARTHALLHARAVDESALPLAPPSGGGPEAAAALLAPPLSSFARHTLLGGGSRGRGGCSGDGVGGGGAMVPAAATTAARAFQAACGGLRLAEAKGGGRKRGREDATAAAEALPGREGGLGAHAEPVRGRDPEAHPQQRRTDSGGGDAERMAAAAAAAAKNGVSAGGSGGEGGDADNAWVHVVKDEPGDEDDEGPHTEMHERVSEMPPPIEDDGFFDDME